MTHPPPSPKSQLRDAVAARLDHFASEDRAIPVDRELVVREFRAVLKLLDAATPEAPAAVPGDRWAMLKATSPSGKTLFVCLCCGRVSPTPDIWCKTLADPNEKLDCSKFVLSPERMPLASAPDGGRGEAGTDFDDMLITDRYLRGLDLAVAHNKLVEAVRALAARTAPRSAGEGGRG